MQLKSWLNQPTAKLSLFLLIALGLASCGTHVPKNTPCLLNSKKQILTCSDGDRVWDIPLLQGDKYVCWSREDVNSIFEYIRRLEAR